MSGTDYSFEGFDEWEWKLMQAVEKTFPVEFEKYVIQLAYELQGQVKQRTPHQTGILQEGWKVGEIEKRGDEYYIEVYNNVEYAEPVEYGHRTRGGKGFVKGHHMMAISLEEVSERLPAHLQEWLSDFLDDL